VGSVAVLIAESSQKELHTDGLTIFVLWAFLLVLVKKLAAIFSIFNSPAKVRFVIVYN
jgi:hypothetical protein